MEQYTLIGHPLGHSMSPFIHERLFAMAGREASYTLTDIAPEHLEGKEPYLRSLQGFNITIPHKMAIIPIVDELDESAKRYNSVNCVANQNGKLIGYNTDCDGFTMSVKEYPMDGKVLLIGCGGVGRMIATEALRHGANLTIGIIPQDKELRNGGYRYVIAGKYICVYRLIAGTFYVYHMAHGASNYPTLFKRLMKEENP
mgnify:CR=1 FL=1